MTFSIDDLDESNARQIEKFPSLDEAISVLEPVMKGLQDRVEHSRRESDRLRDAARVADRIAVSAEEALTRECDRLNAVVASWTALKATKFIDEFDVSSDV